MVVALDARRVVRARERDAEIDPLDAARDEHERRVQRLGRTSRRSQEEAPLEAMEVDSWTSRRAQTGSVAVCSALASLVIVQPRALGKADCDGGFCLATAVPGLVWQYGPGTPVR